MLIPKRYKKRNMILQGNDAKEFAKNMYRPTKEYIDECRRNNERIDKSIKIERIENGFVAHFQNETKAKV